MLSIILQLLLLNVRVTTIIIIITAVIITTVNAHLYQSEDLLIVSVATSPCP